MGIKVRDNTDSFLQRVREEALKRGVVQLRRIGEECVAEAVENGSYRDRTGNLRSSIGYVISNDGTVLAEGGFRQMGFGTEGPLEGRALALRKAETERGLVLIFVAGMQYASLVADRGYNVIDSAEILAHKLVESLR